MKIGIQLFSVKEALKEDALGTLKKLSEIGYKYIEPFSFPSEEGDKSYGLGMNATDAKAFLTDNGIGIAGAHYYPLGNPNFEAVCEYYAGLGSKQIGSGGAHFPEGREDVLQKCELMVKDAEIAKQYGLRYYYHNHYREYQPFEGEMVIDTIMNNTPSDLVFYQLDTFWAARGNIDPVKEIDRLKDRIILLHQKDFSKTAGIPLNVFEQEIDINIPITHEKDQTTRRIETYAEVGTGILPIQDYIDAGNAIGVEYMMLEQDKTLLGEMESVQISMNAFKKYSGVEWE
jgi:sugar phosphate isomerase/epimerase